MNKLFDCDERYIYLYDRIFNLLYEFMRSIMITTTVFFEGNPSRTECQLMHFLFPNRLLFASAKGQSIF